MDIKTPVTKLEFIEQAGELKPKPKTYADFAFVVEDMYYWEAEELMVLIDKYVEDHGLIKGGGFHMTTDADYVPTEEAADV